MPRGSHLALALALVASLLLHSAAIVLIPQAKFTPSSPVEILVEVELAKPQRTPVLVSPPIVVPDVTPDVPATPQAQPRQASSRSGPTPEAVSRALRSGGVAPPGVPRPVQPVELPQRKRLQLDPDAFAIVEPSPPSSLGLPGALPSIQPRPPGSVGDLRGAQTAAGGLLERMGRQPQQRHPLAPTPNGLPEIGGEVGRERLVVHHPESPQVEIANPATVEIEFWVSASGAVVRLQPLRRGEPELDRAAREYVKGFRFNPLSTGQRGEQRGTIRVRFQWR